MGRICDNCVFAANCLTLAQFCRQLVFSTNLDISKVKPVLISCLAANCDLYTDKAMKDRKMAAAGGD